MANATQHRYYARIIDDKISLGSDWTSHLLANIIAVPLAWVAVTTSIRIANKVIDYVLLNNFPSIAKDWCYTHSGQKKSRLGRVQDVFRRGVFAVIIAMRWPGWSMYSLHLWQCALYAVTGFLAFEVTMVSCILVIQVFLWSGNYLAWMSGWDPLGASEARERFSNHLPLTPPQKYNWSNGPTKHPTSVGMARRHDPSKGPRQLWPRVLGSFGITSNDDFSSIPGWLVTDSGQYGPAGDAIYHTITVQSDYQDYSLEELRLQHYVENNRAQATLPTPSHTSSSESTLTHDRPRDSLTQSTSSSGSALPKWMSGRSFRETIFGSSLASSVSRDTFGQSLDLLQGSAPGFDSPETWTPTAAVAMPPHATGSPTHKRQYL